MLGKLIKYEFKATRSLMLTVYGSLLALAVILAALVNVSGGFGQGSEELQGLIAVIFTAAMYFAMISIVMSVVCAIRRFRYNILGPEGYLMNMLPVSAGKKVLAKLTVASVWTILGYLALVASVMIGIPTLFKAITDFAGEISFDADGALSLVRFLLSIVRLYLTIYAALSVGYSFNRMHKRITAAAFIGLNIVYNVLNTAALRLTPMRFDLPVQTALVVLTGAGAYFLTVYFLEHRLNLE